MQVTIRFCLVPPQFRARKTWGGQRPSTNLARRLAAQWLFRVPPCHEGTIHLQTSMSSPGFEPSPYCTAVNVTNHCTGWVTTLDGCYQFNT
ncbi:hypothetical protein TNCV_5039761 [Trichonephila clavipes]|nr:hypothetical protein TNCV_5039761 [Trichonephila clavipes]